MCGNPVAITAAKEMFSGTTLEGYQNSRGKNGWASVAMQNMVRNAIRRNFIGHGENNFIS